MRRRTVLGSTGSTLSVMLAGCTTFVESINGESDDHSGQNNESNESSGADEGDDEEQLYEDESIAGDVFISEGASESLSALRHTYTWKDESGADECVVHVELENDSTEEIVSDMEARIYDEDGDQLASTYFADEPGPEPGETATYSFPFNNCANTASYELEIGGDVDTGSDEPETLLMDDFEGYDRGVLSRSWTLDGGGDADVSPNAALHEESSQGLRQNGDSNVRSFPGSGLQNYPQDGREVSVLMRPESGSSQPWILVGMEEDVWSTETPGWRLIIDPDGGIRIARETGSGAEVLDENSRLPSLVNKTVDCRFIADSSDGIEFWIQDQDGVVLGLVSTDETDGIDDEMSIGFRSTQGVDWDWLRLVDAET